MQPLLKRSLTLFAFATLAPGRLARHDSIMGRTVGGILAGLVVAYSLILAVELVGMQLFPQPPDMNPIDPESVRQHLGEISVGSFVTVLVAWGLAAMCGPMVTRKIAGEHPKWPALTVVVLFAALVAYNLVAIPTPAWMIPSAVIVVATSSVLAMRLTPWARARIS
jgi:predicted MFS family arabinose efflux permease